MSKNVPDLLYTVNEIGSRGISETRMTRAMLAKQSRRRKSLSSPSKNNFKRDSLGILFFPLFLRHRVELLINDRHPNERTVPLQGPRRQIVIDPPR